MTELIDDAEILLVEDNPTDAELAMMALKRRNPAIKLTWVKDGAEALDYLFASGVYANRKAGNGPKVVLLDLRLPKVDGLEVLRRIKSDERTKKIPVVVFTSSREDRDVQAGYDLGANSFISKPVIFDEFSRVVSELGRYWLQINHPPFRTISHG